MTIHSAGRGAVTFFFAPGGPSLPPVFYRRFIDQLAERGTVHTVVFSGTHPDPPDTFPETIPAAAAELRAAIEERRDERPVVLVGHSYGAAVVTELLTGPTARSVGGAVLVSGFVSGDYLARCVAGRAAALPQTFHERWAAASDDPAAAWALLMEHWFPVHFCRVPWPEEFHEALPQINGAFMNRVVGPSILDPVGSVRDWDRSSEASTPTVPTLVVGGAHDYYPEDEVRSIYRPDPDAPTDIEILTSPIASHSIWIEDPETLWTGIDRWLSHQEFHET